MNTFVELWDDVKTIEDAKKKIESDKVHLIERKTRRSSRTR